MKVAVVGSRSFSDYKSMCSVLDKLNNNIAEIISGGAKGADFLARRYAQRNHIKYTEFPANWKRYGKVAGLIRNVHIVRAADEVIAFWDGKSEGTKYTIGVAEDLEVPCRIVQFKNKGGE